MKDLEARVRDAVKFFWATRNRQSRKQGSASGQRDRGRRTASTGGAQMDGFADLVSSLLVENGVPTEAIFRKRKLAVPGFFRAEKKWDLLVVNEGKFVLAIEFKSHIGPSYGNNLNNRSEEALGSATDLWTAYREGAFKLSSKPWLGYLMLLDESPKSTKPVKVAEPHFPVFEEFSGASYAKRYELLITRLVRERLYDAACFVLADTEKRTKGRYTEPAPELAFSTFANSLVMRAKSVLDNL